MQVTCPEGHRLVVREEHAGQRVRCPRCRSVLQAPRAAPEPVKAEPAPTHVFACPSGHYFRARVGDLGRVVRCPACAQSVRLPGPQPVVPPSRSQAAADPINPGAAPSAAESEVPLPEPLVDSTPERLWPLFVIVGGAAAVLLGIALWLRSTGGAS